MKKEIRKIINRNGNRECDICKKEDVLESHHINGRKIKNANKAFNIANICPTCHYRVHLGLIIIEAWFNTTDGRELLWHEKNKESITGESSSPHVIKNSSQDNH